VRSYTERQDDAGDARGRGSKKAARHDELVTDPEDGGGYTGRGHRNRERGVVVVQLNRTIPGGRGEGAHRGRRHWAGVGVGFLARPYGVL